MRNLMAVISVLSLAPTSLLAQEPGEVRRLPLDQKTLDKYGGPLAVFNGYPYLITRVVPTLYHVIVLPSGAQLDELLDIAHRQTNANKLENCLVLASNKCIYIDPDGKDTPSTNPPQGRVFVRGKLEPAQEFPGYKAELERRFAEFNSAHKLPTPSGYLVADPRRGGRPATKAELARMSGAQPNGVPRGLLRCPRCREWRGECLDPNPKYKTNVIRVHCLCENDNLCARCGEPLAEHKLNANHYDEGDGQIWYVPGFMAFSHRCKR